MKKFLLLVLFIASCTTQSNSNVPCSGLGLCLPGYRCIESFCKVCGDGECPPVRGIGDEGGVICSLDDVCVHIPAGALATTVDLAIARADGVAGPLGVSSLSPVYAITPLSTQVDKPLILELPVTATVTADRVTIYMSVEQSGPWNAVGGASSQVTARAELMTTGYVTAAY